MHFSQRPRLDPRGASTPPRLDPRGASTPPRLHAAAQKQTQTETLRPRSRETASYNSDKFDHAVVIVATRPSGVWAGPRRGARLRAALGAPADPDGVTEAHINILKVFVAAPFFSSCYFKEAVPVLLDEVPDEQVAGEAATHGVDHQRQLLRLDQVAPQTGLQDPGNTSHQSSGMEEPEIDYREL
ncbi:hypothetical protein EYF80_053893 [Liparis tanakae]|uniref:Uncharacterized protein n=1 Tax=Liparis tanakae TaxID=230148 RepID=A0A4Z2F4B7_9TELE|nr:hypothetical protein EYF80_053893 [Liparis tanakae]